METPTKVEPKRIPVISARNGCYTPALCINGDPLFVSTPALSETVKQTVKGWKLAINRHISSVAFESTPEFCEIAKRFLEAEFYFDKKPRKKDIVVVLEKFINDMWEELYPLLKDTYTAKPEYVLPNENKVESVELVDAGIL